jgi:enoyl-CoA hydratase
VPTTLLTLSEALERLRDPYALEAYSPLTGDPLLVVDLTKDPGAPPRELLRRARGALALLPCPSVAIRAGRLSSAAESLVAAFDVVVATPDEVAPVAETVRRTPLAAMALVQLLRHSDGRSTADALLAESLVYSTLQAGPEFAAWVEGRERRPSSEAPPEDPAVLVERDGARLRLTLNRPDRHNAFSAEMRDALCEALQVVVADPSISQVTLLGAGPSFSSGGDLDEFATHPDPATAHAIRTTRSPARLLDACARRVRVFVHGACVGAGIELPAFTQRVIAAPDAYFQLPELSMGLVPGAGGMASLPRRIGRQRTAWMALTGARIEPEKALAWGLVDAVEGRPRGS